MSVFDQINGAPIKGNAIAIAATTGTSAICIKWIGSGVASSVEVNSSGDIIFTTDGTTADTTLGLPTANGTIDVSDAAANTWGEVVDNINKSTNWKAYLIGALRSDVSNDSLVTTAETTDCNNAAGVELKFDPVTALFGTEHTGVGYAITANKFLAGKKMRADKPTLLNTWYQTGAFVNALHYINCKVTSLGTNIKVDVYQCDDVANTETLMAVFTVATAVETTVGNLITPIFQSIAGNRIVVRVRADDADITAGVFSIAGRSWNTDVVVYD